MAYLRAFGATVMGGLGIPRHANMRKSLATYYLMRQRTISHVASSMLLATAAAVGLLPVSATAEVLSNGPVVAVGFATKNSLDMTIPSFGWRVELGGYERLDSCMEKIGSELTFPIEAVFGVITGDEDEVEFQIVPMFRLEPVRLQQSLLTPFLEGGVGLGYTGLHDIGLGSNILFSDNLAVGFSMPLPAGSPWSRWSLSYRFRHQSHAGLWAESNSGLNTQYVVLTLE